LGTADDVNGVQDETLSYDITGASRIFVLSMIGTPGTAGVDVLCISHDGGNTWTTAQDALLGSANDATGTILVDGALEAAGAEGITAGASLVKAGPYEGPTAVRIFRVLTVTDPKSPANSIPWTTGAPSVTLFTVGMTSGSPVALA
jgi:hypothetical protein